MQSSFATICVLGAVLVSVSASTPEKTTQTCQFYDAVMPSKTSALSNLSRALVQSCDEIADASPHLRSYRKMLTSASLQRPGWSSLRTKLYWWCWWVCLSISLLISINLTLPHTQSPKIARSWDTRTCSPVKSFVMVHGWRKTQIITVRHVPRQVYYGQGSMVDTIFLTKLTFVSFPCISLSKLSG